MLLLEINFILSYLILSYSRHFGDCVVLYLRTIIPSGQKSASSTFLMSLTDTCDIRVSLQHPLVITVLYSCILQHTLVITMWYSCLPPNPLMITVWYSCLPQTPTRDYRVILVSPSNTHSWLPCDTRVSLQHPLVITVWYSCLPQTPTHDYRVILVSPTTPTRVITRVIIVSPPTPTRNYHVIFVSPSNTHSW